MIKADELTEMIKAESHLTEDPPISAEAVGIAASTALRLWWISESSQPLLTPAA